MADPIVLGVADTYQIEGLDSDMFPITVEVRDQLAAILETVPGPQIEELTTSVMTAVASLEMETVRRGQEIVRLRTNAMDLYASFIDLRTELITNRVIRPEPTPEIEWNPQD